MVRDEFDVCRIDDLDSATALLLDALDEDRGLVANNSRQSDRMEIVPETAFRSTCPTTHSASRTLILAPATNDPPTFQAFLFSNFSSQA